MKGLKYIPFFIGLIFSLPGYGQEGVDISLGGSRLDSTFVRNDSVFAVINGNEYFTGVGGNKLFYFESVAAAKASTSLWQGDGLKLGSGAFYLVGADSTAGIPVDDLYSFETQNGDYAILQAYDGFNIQWLGATDNGNTDDDWSGFRLANEICQITGNCRFYSPPDSYYQIDTTHTPTAINVSDNFYLDGQNSKIFIPAYSALADTIAYTIFDCNDNDNITIKNCQFESEANYHSIRFLQESGDSAYFMLTSNVFGIDSAGDITDSTTSAVNLRLENLSFKNMIYGVRVQGFNHTVRDLKFVNVKDAVRAYNNVESNFTNVYAHMDSLNALVNKLKVLYVINPIGCHFSNFVSEGDYSVPMQMVYNSPINADTIHAIFDNFQFRGVGQVSVGPGNWVFNSPYWISPFDRGETAVTTFGLRCDGEVVINDMTVDNTQSRGIPNVYIDNGRATIKGLTTIGSFLLRGVSHFDRLDIIDPVHIEPFGDTVFNTNVLYDFDANGSPLSSSGSSFVNVVNPLLAFGDSPNSTNRIFKNQDRRFNVHGAKAVDLGGDNGIYSVFQAQGDTLTTCTDSDFSDIDYTLLFDYTNVESPYDSRYYVNGVRGNDLYILQNDVDFGNGDVFYDASTARLGIGLKAPLAPLHVSGTGTGAYFYSSSDNSTNWFRSTSTAKWGHYGLYRVGGTDYFTIGHSGTGAENHISMDGAADRVSIDSFINIGEIDDATATAVIPQNGDMAYVGTTGGVFTEEGFWCYEEGAWQKCGEISRDSVILANNLTDLLATTEGKNGNLGVATRTGQAARMDSGNFTTAVFKTNGNNAVDCAAATGASFTPSLSFACYQYTSNADGATLNNPSSDLQNGALLSIEYTNGDGNQDTLSFGTDYKYLNGEQLRPQLVSGDGAATFHFKYNDTTGDYIVQSPVVQHDTITLCFMPQSQATEDLTQTAGTTFTYDAGCVGQWMDGYDLSAVSYSLSTNSSTTGSLILGLTRRRAGTSTTDQLQATIDPGEFIQTATGSLAVEAGDIFLAAVDSSTGGTLDGSVQGLVVTLMFTK